MIWLVMLAFALMWRLGGWNRGCPGKLTSEGWGGWRKLCLPIALGLAFSFVYSVLAGVLIAVTSSIIRMGDGNWSPEDDPKPSIFAWLTHDRTGCWTKGLHGLTCGLIAPRPRVFLTHESSLHYLALAAGFGLVSFLVRKLNNVWIEEPVRGAFFALVMLS